MERKGHHSHTKHTGGPLKEKAGKGETQSCQSHQQSSHGSGSQSHHGSCHTSSSHSHHESGHASGSHSHHESKGHHVITHLLGSKSHHVTTQVHGSVCHQETVQAAEPIKATPSIGGFFVSQTKEKVSIYQALQKKLVSEVVALAFLEAQAATGHIIDPSNNQKLTVEAAIQQGIVGPEYQQKLLLANSAATGYKHKEETISLFQAFKKGLVGKHDAVRLLQAQIATGGIINYLTGSRVPFSEALKLNYIDENLFKTLTGPSEFSSCYPDPNTKEDTSYQKLLSKGFTDSGTGLVLLTLQESLQGLRKSVNLEQLFKANIITQVQYDEIRDSKQTIQKVGELKEVRKYLNGLSSIGGVCIDSTKGKISIYQALKKNFLPSDCAIALLEAQAASGFIVDPEKKKTFTVIEAIQEGVVGFDLKEKLLNAEQAVTGFNDPYTGKKISLFQAIKKELIDIKLGLNLLQVQLATGGIIDPFHSFHVPLETAYKRGLLDEKTAKLISRPADIIRSFLDPNTDDRLTYQELISRATFDPDSNTYFFPLKFAFYGIRGKVASDELLKSQIIDQTIYENLQQGKLSVQDVSEQEKVKRYLQGTGLIAGVVDISTNEIKSIYNAMKEHLLMPGTSIALLEAQAATGYLIDPVKNLKFSVQDAVKNGLIGPEVYEKLLSAEKASTGYKDPSSGERLSLFQAIKRGFVTKDHGIHLLNVQLATGGIIDPSKKHRVPVEVAYTRGHFDDDTNKILLTQTNDMKGFSDPNLKENVTYEQLLERSVIDLHSGLYLTPVFDNAQDAQKISHSFIDYKTKVVLNGIKLTLTFSKFKGQLVSLWQILFSEYFSFELRQSFINLYKAGTLSVEELSRKVEAEIKQVVSSTKVTFEGLRESVTPGQLLDSEIIDKNLFDKLQQGEASAKDVENINMVKKYLQGTGSIGGLILADTQEKISIYQAKRKGFLRPGTSLILLEAQAATGYIIDPVKNKKYSVDKALKANIIGPDYYEKLLSAEKSVTGYKDPYTGERVSLFQAMSKGLIVKEHGIRLLEAQIATGGIIDPINSHRIPVEVAYKRGYFDKKMNLILSDPDDDTKGFFDPNTHENLTYLQLKEKCITEPSTNLCLLPLVSKTQQFSFNENIRDSFRNLEISVRYGRFRGQTVSAWVLINSEYFTEWRRRELLQQFRLKKLTIEQIIIIIEEEIKKRTDISVPALRGQVNIYELLEYEIIEKELFEQILEGKVTVEDALKMDKVQKYLQGSGVLGGVILQPSNQKVSFYEATKKNILLSSTVLPLLEAQAATGHIVDPVNNQKLSVDEALKAAVVDPQIYERLASAEEAVTGYQDPFSGKKISLFQAMQKGLVEEKHAKQLLEAQLATGGVIDPIHGFHLPDSVAKKHGYLSEELAENLSRPTDDTKSFYDPTTKEKVTYSQLVNRSQKDESTGLYLLPLPQNFAEVPIVNIYSDEEVRRLLKATRIEEQNITVWDLIHSGFFTEEQRFEILQNFKAKKLTVQELTIEILQIVRMNEIKKTTHIYFEGLRGKVPVVRLLDLGIITQKTFDELVQGLKSVEEISQLAEVKKSLEGTGSISGVYLPSRKKKLSIYQALKKNILLPANAIMLLEAQAATGFITDPVKNKKYTVDSAVKAGLIGPELHEKVLNAESAVSGYTDPYTENKISLGQAIQKKLIPQNEGIPLLQAQLATGGIIDPLHFHYVPQQLAYKLGFLDEEISKQTADQKIYVDPNTKEKVSYQQLKERCYTDPETGSLLLTISDTASFYAEEHVIDAFKSFTVTLTAGRFKGQTVSLWELLNSEYVSADKRKEFLLKYKTSSSEALQEIIKTVTTIFEETDAASTQIKFKGLRKQVSASDLFQSEVIDKKTLDELNLGKKTINEVTEMETVKRYLEGTDSIAGVLLQATNKKMSIYEAMLKGILRPGTALVLLEAQAATGFIVDPVKNEKMSVDEAFKKGLIGYEVHAKLLSAEQAVTGYTDPYNEEKISLFQAMQKNIIVEGHGIRLLEAQIATGGIIDPVHSHRVPVDVAYKRGYFNEEINKILLDPSDDNKGFFDPNTHENLTYLQLVERCIRDPETGLYLLQVVKRGENYFYITDKMKADLQSRTIRLNFGRYANQTVSIWEILTSHYITDMKRRELVRLYTLNVLSIEQLISSITTVIEEYDSKISHLKLKGIRGEVSATDLYNADIIDRKTLDGLKEGKISVEAVSELDSVKRYLKGTSCIAGVLSVPTNETLSIFEAINKGFLSRDIGLLLLQAQAATGHLIDPIKNQVLSITDAVSQGLVNSDVQEQLTIAEKAVTGFADAESGNKISIFQAVKKGSVPEGQGISLLDVQLATGGVVDPVYGHRLPLHVAYKRAHLDEDFYLLISESRKKGFVDPNTHERITYKNLLERCIKDQKTGISLLPLTKIQDDYFYIDEPTKKLLSETNVSMNSGKFKGQNISLWELLSSTYISEEKRKQLIKLYKTKTSSTLKDIISVITSVIEEKEKSQNDIWFQGLRKQVTAKELFDAGIINQEILEGLKKDSQTVKEVAKKESIRQYLEGNSCVAGVLIPSKLDPTKKEKVNIYDAMQRRILRPGTALVLLEAQAATGFVIDSIQNRRLAVDEALSAGVIGYEIYDKLLSAERAVTGYNDPYTGEKISLFQAIQKNLIVKEHGIRLLEAQIATGGIIDPVHSHRVPVEVAYKQGYFDEELNQILLDPTDDTKVFFDPNTHENLTYMQLLQRCVQDPDTGLYMLELKDSKFSPAQIQNKLQSNFIDIAVGEFHGKRVSIWELINSKYFSVERREELLKKFESGSLTIEEILSITVKVLNETEETLPPESTTVSKVVTTEFANQEAKVQALLQSEKVDVSVGAFKGQSVSVWELLNSRYISEEKRKEILELMQSGAMTIQEIITMLITTITTAETELVHTSISVPDEQQAEPDLSIQDDEIEKALQNISIHVTKGQYAGQEVSVWDLLNSRYIPKDTKQELLEDYKLTVQDIMDLVVNSIRETKPQSRFKTDYNLKVEVYNVVLTTQIEVTEGEFKGQKHSVWDLLQSKYFSEEKRRELLENFNSGRLSITELIKTIITIITETEERTVKLKFKGLRRQVSASELVTSKIIDKNTLRELAQGQKTIEEVTQMDSVKRYLEGTSCIAGVLVPSPKDPSKKDKMRIYDAMLKNILRQGTALCLLEAQAATGFIVDPVSNKKLSVDEAAATGLIGGELHTKLLSAEKAVTGYTDPYTDEKISLFQAMKKDLIVKDHGIRLLEAQIATGGIIDPVHSHRVPVEVAYKRGYFDEEMNQILLDPTDDTKGFFDPNTHENLTYLQLLNRCVKDPDTGLYMLTMKDKQTVLAENKFETSLQSLTIQTNVGQYAGQAVSSWVLLHSKYFTEEKRQLLLNKYKSKTITVDELISSITSTIEDWEKQGSSQNVNGLSLEEAVQDITEENKKALLQSKLVEVTKGKLQGQKLSVWDLLNSEHIEESKKEDILQKYFSGTLQLEEIIRIITVIVTDVEEKTGETVKVAAEELRGALSAIEVNVKTSQLQEQKISLWDILHSDYLQEDKRNEQLIKHKSTVETLKQIIASLIDESEAKKDTGIQQALDVTRTEVTVGEFKGQNVSLWFLLHSKYVTEEKRKELLEKYVSKTMTDKEILKIIITIIEETEQTQKLKVEKEIKEKLEVKLTKVNVGEFKGQDVSVWFLLYSKYITEEKRTELLVKYKLGTLTEEEILRIVITIIEETEQTQRIKAEKEIKEKLEVKLTKVNVGEFTGQDVSVWFLLYSKYITEEKRKELLEKYGSGTLTDEEILRIVITIVEETEKTQKIKAEKEIKEKLEVKLTKVNVGEFTGQDVSVWFLLYSKYVTEEKRKELLEKYASGTLTDEEILKIMITIIEETEQTQQIQAQKEIQQKLEVKLTEVKVGEFKGQNVSLWFLFYSKYITEEKRNKLIGKYKQGSLTEDEILRIIITIIEETEKGDKLKREKEVQQELELKLTEVTVGEFKGQNLSAWFLLYSKYITEEKRNELLEKYKSGTLTADAILKIIITIIEETEKKRELKFKGFRRQVTASELLQSEIIDQKTLDELTQGSKTVEEVTQMDSVKRYLEGSSSIAGVFVTSKTDPSQKEKLTIYDAMLRRILRPGTALILLEAQAATGFVIDPIQNKKLSVEEALTAGLIGHDIYAKLVSAERGVTGYKDPYTEEKISLFQAMKKDLIVKDHGIRLLEAQIATGGIIDPVHSHRVPVEVAYKRGYFDEEMNQILSDPSDDTKGFFDPNTHENLTYLQLIQRCVKDPETGLYMLDVTGGTSAPQVELKIKSALQSKSVQISVGEFQGKAVSVWDLLYSRYILAEKQTELLKKYRAGLLTIEELITILITIITETEKEEKLSPEIKVIKKSFMSVIIEISIGDFKEKSMSLWDLLHSKYIPEEKREELIQKFKSGTLTIEEIISIVLSMIQKTEMHSTQTVIVQEVKVVQSVPDVDEHWPSEEQLQKALQVIPSDLSRKPSEAGNVSVWDYLHSQNVPEEKRNAMLQIYKSSLREVMSVCTSIITGTSTEGSATQSLEISASQEPAKTEKRVETQSSLQAVEVDMKVGQQESKRSSLWELLHSSHITGDKRNELLAGYESGALGLQDLMKSIMQIFMQAEKTSVQISIRQKVTVKTEQITLESIPEPVIKSLQVFTVSIASSEFTGENISLWDLLQSKNITKAKRLELIKLYFLTIKGIVPTLTRSSCKTVTVVTQKPDTATFLKSVKVQVDIGEFKLKGQSHSLWELLHSQYITEEKRKEIIQKYESGAVTWEQMFNIITTIIKETEEKTHQIKFKE